jgi:hypothetical protein
VQQYHAIPSFFSPYLQSTKMAKKQSKAGRIQTAKNKKKVQDTLHDAVATEDDDIECPTPIDKEPEPGEPKAQTAKNKKEVQDALHDAVATDDDDVECPTPIDKEPKQGEPKALPFTQEMTPDRLNAITVMDTQIEETSPDVASAVSIGDNSPFAIADKTNENPHNNDGEESTVSKVATDDDGLSNVDIPRKKPARPMEPDPQEPKPTTRK